MHFQGGPAGTWLTVQLNGHYIPVTSQPEMARGMVGRHNQRATVVENSNLTQIYFHS